MTYRRVLVPLVELLLAGGYPLERRGQQPPRFGVGLPLGLELLPEVLNTSAHLEYERTPSDCDRSVCWSVSRTLLVDSGPVSSITHTRPLASRSWGIVPRLMRFRIASTVMPMTPAVSYTDTLLPD